MFFSSMIACDYSLQCRSNIRMFIVYQRRLRKSFYTTQCTIKFLMFHISTCLHLNEHMQSLKFPVEVTLNDV